MKTIRILNLGAGVQSTTLYLLACSGQLPTEFAIFADTGDEPEEVYRHLEWLQSLNGPPILVRSKGRLGDDLLRGQNSTGGRFVSIPAFTLRPDGTEGVTRRQCSKEYKIEVIHRAIREELCGLKRGQRFPLKNSRSSSTSASVSMKPAARSALKRTQSSRDPSGRIPGSRLLRKASAAPIA